MRRGSLQTRLVATALLASTLTAIVLVVGLQVLLTRANDGSVRSRLETRASAADATITIRSGAIKVLEGSASLDQNLWVFDSSATLVDGNLPAGVLGTAVRRAAAEPGRESTTAGYRLLSRQVERAGTRVGVVVAAQDLAPYEESEESLVRLLMVLGLVTVVLATGSAWLAATRSLQQVVTMAERADDWREHDRPQRFSEGPGGDELNRLGQTLDRMLDRIHQALLAERRLTDEIAHELRTPLTVIRAEADLARSAGPDPRVAQALDGIVGGADRMRDSIETMLAVAHAHADADDRCTVADLLAAVEQPIGRWAEVVLAAPLPPLLAAVRPLLENAREHGGGEPTVSARAVGATVVVSILDNGPGVPAEDVERVFKPGHSSRAGDGPGAGLGLPLARRMARAVGADVVALPGPGGRFELRVPRGEAAP
ncbi:MAG: sensor histidine kinase [Nocardioides sp.]